MIKQLKLQMNKLGILQISVMLLVIGLILGVLCANLFKNDYIDHMRIYEENIFSRIAMNEIDYNGFFGYVLNKNFSSFVIFWLLCLTILGVPYMAFRITSFGFFSGFFISAVTMQYGLKGLILIVVYVFPQGLLYLPIALISLYKGFELCRTIYSENRNNFKGIVKLLRSYILIILLLAAALLVASFLEAYPGAFLLKKALGSFS